MLTQIELELFGKILLAGLLGFVIGLERELMGSAAGDRTFSLVAIGSALFTVLSVDVFGQVPGESPGRVAANVLTGVGFLGGGMILKEGGTVRGLTTAAGIWAVAAVGMAVATDRYLLAVLATALIMVVKRRVRSPGRASLTARIASATWPRPRTPGAKPRRPWPDKS